MGYKIGSFNIRNLGLSSLKDERDLEIIARIIKEEQFDVIALQEILSSGKAFNINVPPSWVKKSILGYLGFQNWGFEWAEAGAENDPRHEGFAFLWNKRRLRLASTKVLQNSEKVLRTFKPRMCRINKEEMFRQPYYARFTAQGLPGGSNFEIRLLCVHTYYGKNDSRDDREKRQHELDVLMKDIYPQIADRVYKDGMKAYTILLGDYNVELWTSESRKWKEKLVRGKQPAILVADENGIVRSEKYGLREVKTVQEQLTTLKSKQVENEEYEYDGEGYSFNYDHFSYEDRIFQDVNIKVRRVDEAVSKYCNNNFEKYYRTVSDHVPIIMELELK